LTNLISMSQPGDSGAPVVVFENGVQLQGWLNLFAQIFILIDRYK
jgi:sRNA-binding regulator protein Hfq